MEKKTFEQLQEEDAVRQHNSNLANLVSAARLVEETVGKLQEETTNANELLGRIRAAADSPDNKTVRELYQEATSLRFPKAR